MSDFETLVRQACIAEQEFRSFSDAPKMSITAIVQGCLARADASMETLDRLRKLIDEQPQRFANCRGFIRQIMQWCAAGRISSGIPKDTSRMAVPSRDAAALELIGTNFGLYLLWALACQNVHAKNPSVFGDVEDVGDWKARYEALKRKRDALLERVGQEFTPSDTVAGVPDSSGRALITFKIAAGKVPTYPLANAGTRLINHLLDSDLSWAFPQAPTEIPVKRRKQAAG